MTETDGPRQPGVPPDLPTPVEGDATRDPDRPDPDEEGDAADPSPS